MGTLSPYCNVMFTCFSGNTQPSFMHNSAGTEPIDSLVCCEPIKMHDFNSVVVSTQNILRVVFHIAPKSLSPYICQLCYLTGVEFDMFNLGQ